MLNNVHAILKTRRAPGDKAKQYYYTLYTCTTCVYVYSGASHYGHLGTTWIVSWGVLIPQVKVVVTSVLAMGRVGRTQRLRICMAGMTELRSYKCMYTYVQYGAPLRTPTYDMLHWHNVQLDKVVTYDRSLPSLCVLHLRKECTVLCPRALTSL